MPELDDDQAKAMVEEIKQAVLSPDGIIALSPAFGASQVHWGVSVYPSRRIKKGRFLAASVAHGQTPSGALRSLADLLEVNAEEVTGA